MKILRHCGLWEAPCELWLPLNGQWTPPNRPEALPIGPGSLHFFNSWIWTFPRAGGIMPRIDSSRRYSHACMSDFDEPDGGKQAR